MRVSYIAPTDFAQASVYRSLEKEKAINKREGTGPQYCKDYSVSLSQPYKHIIIWHGLNS